LPEPLQAVTTISEEEVREVIHGVLKDKASGPDGIPNRVFKAAEEWLVLRLVTIFNASVRLEYHARV
jgi:hypothetical protein